MEETSAFDPVGIFGCLRNWVKIVVSPIDGKLPV
jgi:hypothetical protein